MNVNLSPELVEFIKRKVSSGLYSDQSEVVREALGLLVERDRLREAHSEEFREFRMALVEGLAQADRGELLEGPHVVAEVRDSLHKRCSSAGKCA